MTMMMIIGVMMMIMMMGMMMTMVAMMMMTVTLHINVKHTQKKSGPDVTDTRMISKTSSIF